MKKIFCLETEWEKNVHNLKRKPTVLALLEFMENTRYIEVPFVFRQVATEYDFHYYIDHLYNSSYDAYDVVYLCFHGGSGFIEFANGSTYTLRSFEDEKPNIFAGRIVVFDCCSTLRLREEDAMAFKKSTGARMVIGYGKTVDFVNSWVFEMWLLNALFKHEEFGPARLIKLAEKEMPEHVAKLGFRVY